MKVFKGVIIASLLLAPGPALLAQPYSPYGPPARGNADPRVRRALRERAVAYAGASSREFVETQGEPAVGAIFGCSRGGARKLVEFSNSGGLAKLPRPANLLRVIAQRGHGDDVLLYAIQHANELTDVDNFDAYLSSPLEYAYGLKNLAEGAAEARARRLSTPPVATSQPTWDTRTLAIAGGLLGVVILVIWKRRSS